MSVVAGLALIIVVGIPTYLMRGGVILGLGDRSIPPLAERALRNVGPAVMAALVVNLVAGGEGGFDAVTVAEVAGIVVAVLVAIWKKNLVLTLVCGMATLWAIAAVI